MTRLIILFFLLASQAVLADNCETKRQQFIENEDTKVWQSTICPNQLLPFHSHQHARVAISDKDGLLKVTYQSGKEAFIKLKKQIPVFLSQEQGKEAHQERNTGKETLNIIVIELKKS